MNEPTVVESTRARRGADSILAKRAVGWTLLLILVSVAALTFAASSGGSLVHPVGHQVWQIGNTVAGLGLLALGIVQSVRAGKLTRLFLMAVATASAFWQETYGDWGAYVLYSDHFATFGWGDTRWSSPVRCWWFVPGYIVFYCALFFALIAAVGFVRHRWPTVNPYITAAFVSLPVFYVFDFVFEGTTTGLGFWNYLHTFGPAMHIGNGTFPLLWPILEQVLFMALAAFALTWRNHHGQDVFEIAASAVTRKPPGQIAILLSWIVLVNVAFLTTTILPIMAMRWLAGPASAIVP